MLPNKSSFVAFIAFCFCMSAMSVQSRVISETVVGDPDRVQSEKKSNGREKTDDSANQDYGSNKGLLNWLGNVFSQQEAAATPEPVADQAASVNFNKSPDASPTEIEPKVKKRQGFSKWFSGLFNQKESANSESVKASETTALERDGSLILFKSETLTAKQLDELVGMPDEVVIDRVEPMAENVIEKPEILEQESKQVDNSTESDMLTDKAPGQKEASPEPPKVVPEQTPLIGGREPMILDSPKIPSNGQQFDPGNLGVDLDLYVISLINAIERGDGLKTFPDLRREIAPVFYSTPTVMRLIELEKTLDTQVSEAESASDFQVSASVEEGRRESDVDDGDGRLASQTISVSRILFDGGVTSGAVGRSRNEVERARADINVSRSEALLDLLKARFELSAAAENMKLSNLFAQSRLQFLDMVREKLSLGVSSGADVVRAEAKAFEAQAEIPASRRRLDDAVDRYTELYGFKPQDQSAFRLPESKRLGSWNPEQHSNVKISKLDYESASLELNQIDSEKIGALSFQLGASRSETPTQSMQEQVDGKLVYQVSLYDGGNRSSRLKRASGQVLEAKIELERVIREQQRIVNSAESNLSASQALTMARISALKSTVTASKATRDLFIFNRGTISDIFRVQEDYLKAAQAVVEGRLEEQVAFFELLHARDELLQLFEITI